MRGSIQTLHLAVSWDEKSRWITFRTFDLVIRTAEFDQIIFVVASKTAFFRALDADANEGFGSRINLHSRYS